MNNFLYMADMEAVLYSVSRADVEGCDGCGTTDGIRGLLWFDPRMYRSILHTSSFVVLSLTALVVGLTGCTE